VVKCADRRPPIACDDRGVDLEAERCFMRTAFLERRTGWSSNNRSHLRCLSFYPMQGFEVLDRGGTAQVEQVLAHADVAGTAALPGGDMS
jgi:hypothetical protein